MISPPHTLSRPDRYGRLLPAFQYSGDPEKVADRLRDLSCSMFEKTDELRADQGELIPAAYTYFGQFITHDLTFDDTPFRSAGLQEPEETINYRTPRLDLDSLYGDGPGSRRHGHLYKGLFFRLGTVCSPSRAIFDVPLVNGLPAVADRRNCENAILRQIHAMFLMLHNVAVRDIPRSVPKAKRFEAARVRVRRQFQWLVRNDFLPNVCKRQICEAVAGGGRLIHWPPGRFSIPVEFSQAASRFGHSMVRGEYRFRKGGRRVPLEELFGSIDQPRALATDIAVDWGRFVRPRGEVAEEIDTHLVNPLRHLPDDSIRLFVSSPAPHGPHVLAERTLCRGAATKLPTGQQVRVALRSNATIPAKDRAWEALRSSGFENETPLWYYILLEAEVNESGRCLGTIGSRIVAEVIEASLRHDQDSFLFLEGGEWMPPPWKVPGRKDVQIQNLRHLAIVVGLE
jgi:hypothetical protein